jgi:formylglycine-generating enzyme required for sulfatase activity
VRRRDTRLGLSTRLCVVFLAALASGTAALAQAPGGRSSKGFALVIGNGSYPDAMLPIASAVKDARSLAEELRRNDFDVDEKENANRETMRRAIDTFLTKIQPGSAALFYFSGFGIQSARESYLIPVDAQIWSEPEVKRDGFGLDDILGQMGQRGARVKMAIIDASRRNPYERRFRASSAGLATIDATDGTLAIFAAAPGKVSNDGTSDTSLFMQELLKEIRTPDNNAEEAFNHVRLGVSRASNREQIPWVVSSLSEDFSFGKQDIGAPAARSRSGPPSSGARAAAPAPPPPTSIIPPSPPPGPAVQSRSTQEVPSPAPGPAPTQGARPATAPPAALPSQTAPPPGPTQAVGPATAPPPALPAQTAPPPGPTQLARPAAAPPAALPVQTALPHPGDSLRDCPDCPELIIIPSGSFDMGTAATPFDRPVHRVKIAEPFAMSRNEITFDDWDKCVAAGACKFKPDDRGWGRGDRPVINVSWLDAKEYVTWLAQKTGKPYRLPSEAEWEYAARGGTKTPFYWGTQVGARMANCRDCQTGEPVQTFAVGSFPPNPFGLNDMAGNAAEWVEDCWNESYKGAPSDGSAWTNGSCSLRVLRGGSFDTQSAYLKPAARFRYDADVRYFGNGFRVARKVF